MRITPHFCRLQRLSWLLLVLVCVAASRAEGALIELGSIGGAGSLTLDTDSGLRWLDLDITVGMSMDEVRTDNKLKRFRYATRDEVLELWSHAGLSSSLALDPAGYGAAVSLMHFLGTTDDQMTINLVTYSGVPIAHGFFAESPESQFIATLAAVASTDGVASSLSTDRNLFTFDADEGFPYVGSYLVSRHPAPEPSAVALVGISLGTWALRRRRSGRGAGILKRPNA